MDRHSNAQSFSVRPLKDNRLEVTVKAKDFIGLLSILARLFASYGINIIRGRAETLAGRANDVFEISVPEGFDRNQFEADLESLLVQAGSGKVMETQQKIHERLIQFIRSGLAAYPEKIYPIDLKMDQEASAAETVYMYFHR